MNQLPVELPRWDAIVRIARNCVATQNVPNGADVIGQSLGVYWAHSGWFEPFQKDLWAAATHILRIHPDGREEWIRYPGMVPKRDRVLVMQEEGGKWEPPDYSIYPWVKECDTRNWLRDLNKFKSTPVATREALSNTFAILFPNGDEFQRGKGWVKKGTEYGKLTVYGCPNTDITKPSAPEQRPTAKPIPGLVGEKLSEAGKTDEFLKMGWRSLREKEKHLAAIHQPTPEQAHALAEQRADLRNHLRGGGWFDPKPKGAP